MVTTTPRFRCVLHGSFGKHFAEIMRVRKLFQDAGIEVLAPAEAEITAFENGFAMLSTDTAQDPRMVEVLYLHQLKKLGREGFSYFVNPEGYVGKSASYELGIAHATNVPCFFLNDPDDHPAYVPGGAVISPEALASHVATTGDLPMRRARRNDVALQRLWEELVVPGSVIAVGGIVEHASDRKEKEMLLVRTHKWGDRWSVVGGKVRRGERLDEAYRREVREELGLRAEIGEDLCTFDQIKGSGYYLPVQHVFVDKVARVTSKRVRLNEEAQEYAWLPARTALAELDIEPNARHVVELYAAAQQRMQAPYGLATAR